MTVAVPTSGFDDSDLAKSLGLLDGCDPFPWAGTPFFGDDMLSFDADLLSMPADLLSVPQMTAAEEAACVSPMVPAQNWPFEPLPSSKRSVSPASSGEFHTHMTLRHALGPAACSCAAVSFTSRCFGVPCLVSTSQIGEPSRLHRMRSCILSNVEFETFLRRRAESWHPTGDSANSSDSASDAVTAPVAAKKDPRIGKRKPEPELDAIADVQERRKQRRLAKNRATAAVSRCACLCLLCTPPQTLNLRLHDSALQTLLRVLSPCLARCALLHTRPMCNCIFCASGPASHATRSCTSAQSAAVVSL